MKYPRDQERSFPQILTSKAPSLPPASSSIAVFLRLLIMDLVFSVGGSLSISIHHWQHLQPTQQNSKKETRKNAQIICKMLWQLKKIRLNTFCVEQKFSQYIFYRFVISVLRGSCWKMSTIMLFKWSIHCQAWKLFICCQRGISVNELFVITGPFKP